MLHISEANLKGGEDVYIVMSKFQSSRSKINMVVIYFHEIIGKLNPNIGNTSYSIEREQLNVLLGTFVQVLNTRVLAIK